MPLESKKNLESSQHQDARKMDKLDQPGIQLAVAIIT